MKPDAIKPPRLAEWMLKRVFSGTGESPTEDFGEVFYGLVEEKGLFRARWWYRHQMVVSLISFCIGKILWGGIMFKNYLKIALRNMKKQKGYTFINIFGLALGIACCMAIYLYIDFESSFDNYHADLDRIYRVASRDRVDAEDVGSAQISGPPGQLLVEHCPQVEAMTQLLPVHDFVVKRGERAFYENKRFYADTKLFNILTIPFVKGDPSTALDMPSTVVISETMASKYFGDEDPMGQSLEVNGLDHEVTGIMKDFPANTHLKADCFVSMERIRNRYPFHAWFLANLHTYVKLRPDTDVPALNEQMAQFVSKYAELDEGDSNENVIYYLQPVRRIHLHSHLQHESEPCTKPAYLTIFSAIGTFILLIACVNFINLSTARSAKRAREVGMRKVVGAQRKQLIRQFMSESFVITLAAVLIAVLLLERTLPLYRNLTQIPLTAGVLFSFKTLLVFVGLIVLISCVAGVYPALVLSSFQPVQTLKDSFSRGSRGAALRKVLVTVQFTLSVLLIIGTMIVFQQINFMKNESLGFDKEQKLIIPLRGTIRIDDNYETIKAAVRQHPGIINVSTSNIIPGQQEDCWWVGVIGEGEDAGRVMNFNYVDPDFLSVYGLRLTAGRFFNPRQLVEIDSAMVLNMAAVREYGWSSPEEALTKRLWAGFQGGPVIGVIEDFHYKGLQAPIEPLAMMWRPSRFQNITITFDTRQLSEVMAHARSLWDEFVPDYPFDYYFLDESFDRQYRSEEKISKMLGGFTFLGVFIACLGLFGLASFTAEQKTKEIGIRKVLGASVSGLVALLTRSFIRWVILANIIAWPMAYFASREWLKNFAYRIDVQLGVFAFSAVLAVLIALLTVSYQAIRAAKADPVDSLKYE